MSQPAHRPWTLEEFFAWQERQEERHELVNGHPLRMMAGVGNVHDQIVVNLIAFLRTSLRGSGCTPFTGDSAIETYPGQIRRPDMGVDCGRRDPQAYKASEPRLVIEVLSPSTRDFDTVGKLTEYQSVPGLDHILYVEPNRPEVRAWSRDPAGSWSQSLHDDLGSSIEIPAIGVTLALANVYEGVAFPPGPRLIFGHEPES